MSASLLVIEVEIIGQTFKLPEGFVYADAYAVFDQIKGATRHFVVLQRAGTDDEA